MTRRGVTLLELLLAIALVLALAAVLLPTTLAGLRERAFESSAEIVRSQLLLARAHAQSSGRPVEVHYEVTPARVEARHIEVGPEPEDGAGDDPPDEEIPLSWARRALADGVWLAEGVPEEAEDGGGGAAGDEPALADETGSIPVRLAVYLPDGSALVAAPAWLGDDHGRRGRLAINPWTGLPVFERRRGVLDETRRERETGETEPADEGPDEVFEPPPPAAETRAASPGSGDDGVTPPAGPDRSADDEPEPEEP